MQGSFHEVTGEWAFHVKHRGLTAIMTICRQASAGRILNPNRSPMQEGNLEMWMVSLYPVQLQRFFDLCGGQIGAVQHDQIAGPVRG